MLGSYISQGLLLFIGLFGTIFSFLSPLELPVNFFLLLWNMLCFSLLFVIVNALPTRLKAITVFLSIISFLLVLWRLWHRVALGAKITGWYIWRMYAEGYPGTLPPPPERTFALGAFSTEASSLFFLFIIALLAAILSIAVVWGKGFWLALLCTLPFWAAPLVVTITPPGLALLAVGSFLSVLLLSGKTAGSSKEAAGKLRLFLLPITALFLGALTLFFPREADYARMPWAETLRIRLNEQSFSSIAPELTPPGILFSEPGKRSFMDTLSFSRNVALRVTAPGPCVLYLRGFSSGVYTGDAWEALPPQTLATLEPGLPPALYFGGDALSNTPGNYPFTVEVENIAANPDCLYTPYFLNSPLLQQEKDSYFLPFNDFHVLELELYLPVDQKTDPVPSSALKEGRAAYSRFAQQAYLQVPPELATKLVELAEKNGISHSSVLGNTAVAGQVAAFIRQAARYEIFTPPPPQGQDFVSWFLFESREGYCMHFASAATLMLRSMGVPARYVEGYVARPEDFSSEGVASVTGQRLHAWVEVYDATMGWIPLDVTPGQGPSDSPAFLLPQATVRPGSQPEEEPEESIDSSQEDNASLPSKQPEEDSPDPEAPSPPSEGFHLPSWVWQAAAVFAGILFIAGSFLLRRRWAAKRREKRFNQTDHAKAALAIYAWLLRLPEGEKAIPEELQLLAQKARFGAHGISSQELDFFHLYRAKAATKLEQESGILQKLLYRYWYGLV